MHDALEFWDREVDAPVHVSWMANDEVRRYINRSISGDEALWPFDWIQGTIPGPFPRALSIGCGTGVVERDLVRRGVCLEIDAFDGSIRSLEEARREAAKEGYEGRIRYFAADFNATALPRERYDLVVVHQALHHVAELELLFAAIMRTLKPEGLLVFDEYVGPSRFDWRLSMLPPYRAIYDALPAKARIQPELLMPIQADDPSEAFRSSEIMSTLSIGFDIVERRDYGGNLLSVLFPAIDWRFAPDTLVGEIIAREQQLLREGEPSFHTMVIARPRRGEAGAASLAAYAQEATRARRRRAFMQVARALVGFKRRVGAAVKKRLGVRSFTASRT